MNSSKLDADEMSIGAEFLQQRRRAKGLRQDCIRGPVMRGIIRRCLSRPSLTTSPAVKEKRHSL
jgi:hypothetical protein